MGYILPINNYTREQYHVRVIEKRRSINGVERPYKIVLYEIRPDREESSLAYDREIKRFKKRKLVDPLPEDGILLEGTGKGERINVRV